MLHCVSFFEQGATRTPQQWKRLSWKNGADTDTSGDCNSAAEVKSPAAREIYLLADAEFADNVFVSFGVVFLQVVKQAATLADHHEEAPPGGVIFFVYLEMLGQFTDTFA
jgi:hypothetical protein